MTEATPPVVLARALVSQGGALPSVTLSLLPLFILLDSAALPGTSVVSLEGMVVGGGRRLQGGEGSLT